MEEKNTAPELILRHQKQKSVGSLLLLTACVLLLFASAILPLQDLTSPENAPGGLVGDLCEIFYVLVGYSDYVYLFFRTFAAIGGILLGLWTIQEIRIACERAPLLTVGEDGITDNISAYRVGLIPWDDIQDIRAKTSKRAGVKRSYIEVTVKSGAAYLPVMRKRVGAKRPVLTGAGMLDIPIYLREADADTVQIAVYMRKLLNEHRKSIIPL